MNLSSFLQHFCGFLFVLSFLPLVPGTFSTEPGPT